MPSTPPVHPPPRRYDMKYDDLGHAAAQLAPATRPSTSFFAPLTLAWFAVALTLATLTVLSWRDLGSAAARFPLLANRRGVLDALSTPPDLPPSTLLYAASYSGFITSLKYTYSGPPKAPHTPSSSLDVLATSDECGPSPSWLTLDYPNSVLYCTDEGLSSDHGSVSVLDTATNGSLNLLGRVNVLSGPVSAQIYGDRGRGLAVAQYGGSSVTWLDNLNQTGLSLIDSDTFSLAEPGPDPSRQEAPHPHQVFADPTGDFIVVPDLGADLVRVYGVNRTTLGLTELEPLVAAPGSGPRHVDFLVTPDGATFMYLISELSNTITGYRVSYPAAQSMKFDRFFQCPTHGAGNDVPEGASGSEITVSPDGRFLTISSRDERSFAIPKPGSSSTEDPEIVDSDSLITFAIDPLTGALAFLQKFPAGGMIPRHFSINKAGTLVAVALQRDGRVVIIRRDCATGQLSEILASVDIEGQVTTVIFAE